MASVTLKAIYKVYTGNVTAVSDFTLDIQDKEFIVLVGPSGCGKSTTLRMVAGLEEITDGELYIADKLVNDVAPKDRDIAMVFQNYALYPHMTVYDNMAFGLKLRKTPKSEIERRVREAAKILDIEHLLSRKPKALSGGQRQRVALGRAIVREPKVFLMDEPLSNLDAKLRVQMRTEITKLHQRLQTTFIYVTHDQTEALTMGTRIVVMKDGFIQQVDTPQNLYDFPINLFVAGFIGSPQMNFFDVTLVKEGDGVYAEFGSNKVQIPATKIAKFIDEDCFGKKLIMGVRPEDLSDSQDDVAARPKSTIDVDIEVVEMLGSETYLYVKTSGKEENVIARVDPRTISRVGDKIKLAMGVDHLHFFDPETEGTLLNR
ncbi:MAG: sn-glycerol-3-phosphate ABC transporter ATP-binding protein UgpC [Clostridia bacterium]|nr:sn-glycerol-3-phosphate ABC transporter ATP-binding protein UgpC [Clostridia bacterium]